MASLTSNIVFDDIFVIEKINPDGKYFDRGMFRMLVAIFHLFTTERYSFPTSCYIKKLLHGPDVGL